MESKAKKTISMIGLLGLAVVIAAGCMMKGVNLREAGIARVEILASTDPVVRIDKVGIFQDGRELVVTGWAYKNGPRYGTYEGHIDVAVIDTGGKAVNVGTAEYRHVPSRHRYSPFEVRLPLVAERGTLVRLLFHPTDGNGSRHLAEVERLRALDPETHS